MTMKDGFKLKRITIYGILFLMIFFVLKFLILPSNTELKVFVKCTTEENQEFQLLSYDSQKTEWFDGGDLTIASAYASTKMKKVEFYLPNYFTDIRLDPGVLPWVSTKISEIQVIRNGETQTLTAKDIIRMVGTGEIWLNDLEFNGGNSDLAVFKSTGDDPYIVFTLGEFVPIDNTIYYVLATVLALFITVILYKFVYLIDIIGLIKNIIMNRRLMLSLAMNDFKVRYAGSYFGTVWAFAQPVSTVFLFWFVFQVGLRSTPVKDVPFILWLMSGLIPWFFFSEAWGSSTNAFLEYSYLVKKILFNIDILPLVKIISALFVHLFFMVFMMAFFSFYKYFPNVRMLFLFYFMFCMMVYAVSLGFITSSLVVFMKDINPLMGIVLQFAMWLTPIMWNVDILPKGLVYLFKLNPVFYIVQGYRWCMIGNAMPCPQFKDGVYFWFITLLLLMFGLSLFRRLRPHFADIL